MLLKTYMAWGFAVLLGFVAAAFTGQRAPRIDLVEPSESTSSSSSGFYGGHGSGGFGGSSGWGWGK